MNAKYEQHLEFCLKTVNRVSFHSHLHMYCEIMYVTDGSVAATVDGVRYIASKNQAFLYFRLRYTPLKVRDITV